MAQNGTQEDSKKAGDHAARFSPVFDSRKRKVRGLWVRNGIYYARITMADSNGRKTAKRIRLQATRLDEVKKELEDKRSGNRAGNVPLPGFRPTFAALAEEYKASPGFIAKADRAGAARILDEWTAELGTVRIDKITAPMIVRYRNKRLLSLCRGGANRGAKVTQQTVNKEVTAFRGAIRYAEETGHFNGAEPVKVRNLKIGDPARKRLLSRAEVAELLAQCRPEITKNGRMLAMYLRFLLFTGARESQALQTRWEHVDFQNEQIHIPPCAKGRSKMDARPIVNFNRNLRELLEEMKASRPPDSEWLFPSPQRGTRDVHAHTLRESFRKVRTAAKVEWAGFHHFRHFFASECVMAGIDFMSIARWLGHRDGGALVAKTYGHLNDAHLRSAANKLSLI